MSIEDPDENIYTRLPRLVVYYLTRWAHLNLITRFRDEFVGNELENDFLRHPDELLDSIHADSAAPWPALLEVSELTQSDVPDDDQAEDGDTV